MTQSSFPAVRLLPKTDARAIRRGVPWVYANELVMDRRTKGLTPGSIVLLQDSGREDLALATFNPNSRIAARILDRDTSANIDADWLSARIQMALELRERLYDGTCYRLIHAEADGLPGVVVDRFDDVLAFQPNAAWADLRKDLFADVLMQITDATTVVLNGSGRARAAEGLEVETYVLRGELDAPRPVKMNGATYFADVIGGQKTGLFFDQRPNHAFVQGLCKGARVLDVFSHVGGFGLAALAGGATDVTCVDGSRPALDLAAQGAQAMGCAAQFTARQGDAFDQLAALAEEDAMFDVVICDPPAFAPGKAALEAGLRAYERVARLAAPLVAPGGYLTLCSCSHAADLARFRGASLRGIGRAGRQAQLLHTGFAGPDHPQLPQLAESGYLKTLTFRLVG